MGTGIRTFPHRYEIRFQPVMVQRHTLAFPCDEHGRVDLDTLGDRARNNYFYARVGVGRDYRPPTVVSVTKCEAVNA
jgi:hypothetical protein